MKILSVLLLSFLFLAPVYGQETETLEKPKPKIPSTMTADIRQSMLEVFTEWGSDFNDKKFYVRKIEEAKKSHTSPKFDEALKKINSLEGLELDSFYIWQAELLTQQMAGAQQGWAIYLKRFELGGGDMTQVAKWNEDASLLLELRKEFAVKFEKFVEKKFKEHEGVIPEAERAKFLKDLKGFHTKQKLIDRE